MLLQACFCRILDFLLDLGYDFVYKEWLYYASMEDGRTTDDDFHGCLQGTQQHCTHARGFGLLCCSPSGSGLRSPVSLAGEGIVCGVG